MSSSEDEDTDSECENPPCVTHAVVADPLGVEVTRSSVSDRVAFLSQNQSDRVEKPLDSGFWRFLSHESISVRLPLNPTNQKVYHCRQWCEKNFDGRWHSENLNKSARKRTQVEFT